jgi:hypothetical protein
MDIHKFIQRGVFFNPVSPVQQPAYKRLTSPIRLAGNTGLLLLRRLRCFLGTSRVGVSRSYTSLKITPHGEFGRMELQLVMKEDLQVDWRVATLLSDI